MSPSPERNAREHNLRQKRYFEQSVKRTMVPTDSLYLRRHVDEMMRFAGGNLNGRVLEVGCGMGRYTLILARRGVRVEGIDLSPVLLDRLRAEVCLFGGVYCRFRSSGANSRERNQREERIQREGAAAWKKLRLLAHHRLRPIVLSLLTGEAS